MTSWQPIETAPRDGTWLLLRGGHDGEYGGFNPPCVVAKFTRQHEYQFHTEGRWQFAYYDGGFLGEYHNPTHWAPLPQQLQGGATRKDG